MAPLLTRPKARTVALVGSSASGKTSLLESLVVATGGLDRPGRIEDGTTLCGTDPEERRHLMSLGIGMAPVWVGDDKLTILDSPGFIDFHSEVNRAVHVADVAVLVVNAVNGVQGDTAIIWDVVQAAGVPAVVFVNCLDAERADFESTFAQLEQLVGPRLAPLELPMGQGSSFAGIIDLLADDAITYGAGGASHGPIPGQFAELEQRARASLIEAIVVGDDSVTERYLDGEVPTINELESVLGGLMSDARIYPLVCGSGVRGVGVDRLATLLDEITESRPIALTADSTDVMLPRDPEAMLVLRAFKVIVDPYVGRIVVFEVISGTLDDDAMLFNPRTQTEERLHAINYLFGTKLVPVKRAVAGDVVAVAKLHHVMVDDVLSSKGHAFSFTKSPALLPALSVALVGSSHDDDVKISTAINRLAEEDPSLGIRHDPTSRRLVIDAMGDVHLQVTLERLRRRFGVEVTTEDPTIEFFETIRSACDVEGRLKKQTGGHGQYAVVNLKVEPIEPLSPFEFVDAVVGGTVPRQYIGAVRSGIEKAMRHGGPQGRQVVGLKVTLRDGKYHSVDSSEAAFETAASLGLRAALDKAGTNVLERIFAVTTSVPTAHLGDVLNDFSVRRGKVISTVQDDEFTTVVTAHVPESELQRYGLDLRNMTGGRGWATLSLHHLAEASKASTIK
jgi:elongation factor G